MEYNMEDAYSKYLIQGFLQQQQLDKNVLLINYITIQILNGN